MLAATGSVVVSVGAVVGMEEVVEGLGAGDGEELAQLNPSGHVWHAPPPPNKIRYLRFASEPIICLRSFNLWTKT